jgi:hemerythrin-like domain-containing protein
MLPIGPLMIEHRLIERMIALMSAEADQETGGGVADLEFIRTAVDFIQTYADQLHHGKEEHILFRELAAKPLSAELRRIMDELTAEHVTGRGVVRNLIAARGAVLQGERSALKTLAETLRTLVAFYPPHIAKEDRQFFIPVMNYFTPAEQAALLIEFNEFDRKFIHLHYQEVVAKLDGKSGFPIR